MIIHRVPAQPERWVLDLKMVVAATVAAVVAEIVLTLLQLLQVGLAALVQC